MYHKATKMPDFLKVYQNFHPKAFHDVVPKLAFLARKYTIWLPCGKLEKQMLN
jgi:hypothetical protein